MTFARALLERQWIHAGAMISNTHPATPRRIATGAKASVIVGAGVALGLMTAHLQSAGLTVDQSSDSDSTAIVAAAPTEPVKPKVVTIVKKKHVPSKPIIIYRKVPVYSGGSSSGGSSSGGGSNSGSSSSGGYSGGSSSSGGSYSGGSSSGGSTNSAPASKPAPQPAPAPAPAPATSKSS